MGEAKRRKQLDPNYGKQAAIETGGQPIDLDQLPNHVRQKAIAAQQSGMEVLFYWDEGAGVGYQVELPIDD